MRKLRPVGVDTAKPYRYTGIVTLGQGIPAIRPQEVRNADPSMLTLQQVVRRFALPRTGLLQWALPRRGA